jgi:hypothetical protein
MAAYKWYNVHKELKFLTQRIVRVPLEKFVKNYTWLKLTTLIGQ